MIVYAIHGNIDEQEIFKNLRKILICDIFYYIGLLHHSSLDFFNIFQKKFWFVIVFFKWENLYTWILLCHSSWDFFNNTKVFERKFWCDIFWTREFVYLDAIPSQGNLGTVSELWNALSIISEFFLPLLK